MSHLHILYIWNDLKNLQKPFYFQIPEYAKDVRPLHDSSLPFKDFRQRLLHHERPLS